MRIGRVQQDIINYLYRCGLNGGGINSLTTAQELRGYDREQVDGALKRLISRGLVRSNGLRYIYTRLEPPVLTK